MTTSKLVLGTAQIGMDYGIANTRGRIPLKEVHQIFDFAFLHGISILDTATNYGDSERIIGGYIRGSANKFNIISKLPAVSDGSHAIKSLEQSLKILNVKKLFGYLFHDFNSFINNPSIFHQLFDHGGAEKIGFSVYSPEQVTKLWELKIKFKIIQLPYNVFDRRFDKVMSRLREEGCEIHARSAFLQGLVFKDVLTL